MKRRSTSTKVKPPPRKGWPPSRIRELSEIITSYGGDPAGFWSQHAHSYEHFLARRSLRELERFYGLLFTPGRTLADIQKDVIPWPKASKYEGKPPSIQTLASVLQRFRTDMTLNDVSRVAGFLDRFKKKTDDHPLDAGATLDSLVRILTNEIVSAKTEGMPVHAFGGSLKLLLKKREHDLEERKVILLEKKAAQADEAQKALESAKNPQELAARIQAIFGISPQPASSDGK